MSLEAELAVARQLLEDERRCHDIAEEIINKLTHELSQAKKADPAVVVGMLDDSVEQMFIDERMARIGDMFATIGYCAHALEHCADADEGFEAERAKVNVTETRIRELAEEYKLPASVTQAFVDLIRQVREATILECAKIVEDMGCYEEDDASKYEIVNAIYALEGTR